jgi:nucleoside-diphosphate-sugar epimerase
MLGAETVAADLTNYQQTLKAVQGSTVVYLLVGLEYDTNIWKKKWPVIMTNVINACKASNSKLIFFDNVYMYGKVDGKMTEETSFNPSSKKGEIRATIATQLISAMKDGDIKALIARSADFYGAGGFKTSVPNMLVFQNLKKGKKAQWLVNADVVHSFTYVPDAAKALYLLAQRDNAFGQTWHLPTAVDPLTGRSFVQQAAAAMQGSDKVAVLSKTMLRIAGLFMKTIRESYELLYQSEYAYVFDSTKFNASFMFQPTSYNQGIKETAEWAKKSE